MKPELKRILSLPAEKAAPLLLGWELVRITVDGEVRLKIVETEAYHQDDPASHSFRGVTKRTAPMFEPGGRLYIYFTYGMHYGLNIVTGKSGVGEAVLLRAGEPVAGLQVMQNNRGTEDILKLTSGPGRLTQAIGIKDTKLSGEILNKSSIFLEPPTQNVRPKDIQVSPRIGITKAQDIHWRFYIKDNPFVSRVTKVTPKKP